MRIAAVIALAAAALFVLYNVVPRGGDDAIDENNASRLMVEATNAASEQAGTMMDLFREMSPTGIKVYASTASANTAANGVASAGGVAPAKVVDENAPPSEAGEGAESQPEAAPDIWPSDAYISETPSEVQKAYGLMKQYSEQGELYSDKFVQAARDLREAWEPLYVQAHKEYKELNTRIELAKSAFTDYFEQKSALAAAMNDPEFRKRMRESDLREQEMFDSWATQADNIAALAYDIMQDMQDVDIYIARTNLSAHFTALQNDADGMSDSLQQLDIEIQRLQIGDFRAATDELNSILLGQSALTAN